MLLNLICIGEQHCHFTLAEAAELRMVYSPVSVWWIPLI